MINFTTVFYWIRARGRLSEYIWELACVFILMIFERWTYLQSHHVWSDFSIYIFIIFIILSRKSQKLFVQYRFWPSSSIFNYWKGNYFLSSFYSKSTVYSYLNDYLTFNKYENVLLQRMVAPRQINSRGEFNSVYWKHLKLYHMM